MKIYWHDAIVWSALSIAVPLALTANSAVAQFVTDGCSTCQLPTAQCQCMAQRPVVETQMVPRQVTVMRNEVVTQYRQEAFTQTVPVTTYRQVVVDEGHYQQVWMPRPVTKQVPQVVYQPQTAYRSVPCQTTRQVPQVVTQMVPQQFVRYQPYTYQTQTASPCGAAPCQSCGTTMAPMMMQAQVPVMAPSCTAPSAALRNPISMLSPIDNRPTTAARTSPIAPDAVEPNSKPVPDPKFLDSPGAVKESWTTVGSRNGGRSGNNTATAPSSANEPRIANDSGVRFKPARTVYRSWESQTQMAGEAPDRQ